VRRPDGGLIDWDDAVRAEILLGRPTPGMRKSRRQADPENAIRGNVSDALRLERRSRRHRRHAVGRHKLRAIFSIAFVVTWRSRMRPVSFSWPA
jgi:hypothetical protein